MGLKKSKKQKQKRTDDEQKNSRNLLRFYLMGLIVYRSLSLSSCSVID